MTHYVDALAEADQAQDNPSYDELCERLREAEETIEDWRPFVLNLRMTIAQLAQNPMVAAMLLPAQRDMLTKFLPGN